MSFEPDGARFKNHGHEPDLAKGFIALKGL